MPPPGWRSDESPLGPFLKWAGGKRALLDRILPRVPERIGTYFEPFLGGGAVFFELARQGRFRRAVLADRNEELIHCYRAIRSDVGAVIRALGRHRYDPDSYYRVRDSDPARLSLASRAARTIYLNKTGYNGLYRVNSAGRFNVPFGRHRVPPRLCDPERLQEVARALENVELSSEDFESAVSATAYFTAYSRSGFDEQDQRRLAKALRALGDRGVPALLSNSDCAVTRRLYRGLPRQRVEVRRAINSVAERRGPVPELLVKSFPYPC
jgi:DNA adenine methylase